MEPTFEQNCAHVVEIRRWQRLFDSTLRGVPAVHKGEVDEPIQPIGDGPPVLYPLASPWTDAQIETWINDRVERARGYCMTPVTRDWHPLFYTVSLGHDDNGAIFVCVTCTGSGWSTDDYECDGCGRVLDVWDARFECTTCPDYDLCPQCSPTVAHDATHTFLAVPEKARKD